MATVSIKTYIESAEYFIDARKWYASKYLYPLLQRSMLVIGVVVFAVLLLGIGMNLRSLFPLIKSVRYAIYSDNSFTKIATIKPANQVANNPLASIGNIMVSNYVLLRESYDYARLKEQFAYVQNNSTRIIFRKFYNYMSIDDASSPVMRYQKYIRRSINILSIEGTEKDTNSAIVNFESIAKSSSGELLENIVWRAFINYDIDNINTDLATNSKFNFAVTGYKLQLILDKMNKK